MAVKPRPYVGITGFMDPGEVRFLLENTPPVLLNGRDLMVGVLVNWLATRGVAVGWPGRHPKVENIPTIFASGGHYLNAQKRTNLIHLTSYVPELLGDDMIDLMTRCGPDCHGFQLNLDWPPVQEIAQFRERFPKARVVLQIGEAVQRAAGWDANEAYLRIRDYVGKNGPVTDLHLTLSSGEDKWRRTGWALPYLRVLRDRLEHPVGLGFGGGLSVARIPELTDLLSEFPDLSLNAERQIRTPLDDPANNKLDQVSAFLYYTSALCLIDTIKQGNLPRPA